jgi:hypothetical protein
MALPGISVVALVLGEHRPKHSRVLVCNRDQRLVIAFALVKLPDPSLQAACVRGVGTQRRLQRTSGSLDKQRSQIDVSAQADVTQPRLATRAVLAWG